MTEVMSIVVSGAMSEKDREIQSVQHTAAGAASRKVGVMKHKVRNSRGRHRVEFLFRRLYKYKTERKFTSRNS